MSRGPSMRRLPRKIAAMFGAAILAFLTLHVAPSGYMAHAQQAVTQQMTPTVQDTLNKRCVVCHGCYDAPCQLKLSSAEGWRRGASKDKVYNSSRLDDAPMTRLGIDAKSVPAWRQKGFFPVTGSTSSPSQLVALLKRGRDMAFTLGAPLPLSVEIGPHRKNSCPAPAEMAGYLKDHTYGGMPHGTAPLSEDEFNTLLEWAEKGAPALSLAVMQAPLDDVAGQISEIETFLNQPQNRSALVARYLYEHLFLAHLHLEGDTHRRFFRLIRSRTGPGKPADEIATRRPFDDPGETFHYRLIPIDGTILHKEHITYEIGPRRLKRYDELFLKPDWALDQLPPYSIDAGGNPLSTFQAIPARSRYQFLLDDALYFVRSFIRGPVCYGQVAVNVIEDRFWVSFLDPDADLSVTDPTFLQDAIPILELPVARADGTVKQRLSSLLTVGPIRYQRYRRDRYARQFQNVAPPDYDHIWDGDGHYAGARLTVYRNFSSASVVTGFVGSVPKTGWVIDFPLFERIYYNLVAGFDVFGNVEHQLTTRIYMDSLRREGERSFLSFLPPETRQDLHADWYRGPLVELVDRWKESTLDTSSPTGISFKTDLPKAEFLTGLLENGPDLWLKNDPINRCDGSTCAQAGSAADRLRPLTVVPAPFAKFLPDISVLLVEDDTGTEVFTLVHDMAHSNVAFIFNEDLRREPERDTMTVVQGQFSSYPNFVFRVRREELDDFVAETLGLRKQEDFLDLISKFGIRRTHPEFWSVFDEVQAKLNAQSAVEAGVLDINRYDDPKSSDPIERLFGYTYAID